MIDAGDDEASVGLLFVALTRVRHPTHIAFNPWPGIERVTSVIARKQALKNRKVHEVNLRALALQTAQRYGHPTVAPTSKQAAASRKSPVTASLLQPRLRQTRSSPSKRKSPDKPQQQPPVKQPQRRSPRKHASPQKPPISPAAHQHLPKAIALIPSIFRRRNQVGDFLWEINASLRLSQSSGSSKTLWIFNDNQEDRRSSVAGGGNAGFVAHPPRCRHPGGDRSRCVRAGRIGQGCSPGRPRPGRCRYALPADRRVVADPVVLGGNWGHGVHTAALPRLSAHATASCTELTAATPSVSAGR